MKTKPVLNLTMKTKKDILPENLLKAASLIKTSILHDKGANETTGLFLPLQKTDGFESSKEAHEQMLNKIKSLPKVDLHRHLEGSFTPEQILEVASKHDIPLPANTVEELRPYVQITDADKTLLDFLKKFDTLALLFKNKEVIKELTYKVIEDANKDNLRYLELRFAPHYMQSKSQLTLEDITDSVLDGIKEARKDFPQIRVEPILIAVRHLSQEQAKEIVDLSLQKGIRSVDLASDEFNFPPELFCHVFKEAKAKGLNVTIHAGEARGADSVKTALNCGADRIGHGVRISEDPALVLEIKNKQVPLEICPTSNVQTGAVKSWEDHPVKKFYDNKLNVTINTDDPGVSGITLSNELLALVEKYGFTIDDLKTVIINGANSAFLPEKEKELLVKRLRNELAQGGVLKTPLPERKLEAINGCEQFAYLAVTPEEVSTPEKRSFTADQMLKHLKKWPTISAVISSVHNADGNTTVIVASPENAIKENQLRGVYDITRRLSGSKSIKEAAKRYPAQYHNIHSFDKVRPFDENGHTMAIRLPGLHDVNSISTALKEGEKPNQLQLVKELVENLPEGKRVALLLGGPSGAGKTTLIDEIKKFAGNREVAVLKIMESGETRKVAVLNGDMYFRDMDDPKYPETLLKSPYWDNPQAMHFNELCEDIAELVVKGKSEIPVYDFTAKVSGITNPNWKDSGKRVGYKTVGLGSDDILLIDSLHAMNDGIIQKLKSLNLPHASIYIDTPLTDDRLLRKVVRDHESRMVPPEQTIQYWNETTFPGETEFIRPTILNLNPAQDVSYLTEGPNDLGLTKETIEKKIKLFNEYGLSPTIEAFSIANEQIEEFAREEVKHLNEIISSNSSSQEDKQKAQKALKKMKSAPRAGRIFQLSL